MARSQGDPRVLFVINLVLSAALAGSVLWGLDFIGAAEFTRLNMALGTGALMVLTWLVVR